MRCIGVACSMLEGDEMGKGSIKKLKKRIDHVVQNFTKNTLMLYYNDKGMKNLINQ